MASNRSIKITDAATSTSRHSRPAGLDDEFGAVLLGGQPTDDALTRIGRSLLTKTTSRPSAARFRATAKMRVSLSPRLESAG